MKSSEKRIEKIDQLFKNKLDDHSIAPSENAWARVEAELSKKNRLWLGTPRPVLFWRMAAAVFLAGALLSVVYWSQIGGEAEKVSAKKSPTLNDSKKEAAQTPANPTANSGQVAQQKNAVKQKEAVNHLASKKGVAKKEAAQHEQPSESKKKMIEIEKELAQVYTVKLDHVDANQGATKEEKIKDQATQQAQVASIKQKPIKLEFTLEALPSEETVATTTEEKTTGIRKVLNLAREVKQGDGLGSLREKKDELLAHNFLTKKERNQ